MYLGELEYEQVKVLYREFGLTVSTLSAVA